MHDHKKLDVWVRSIALTTEVYLLTDKLPSKEKFNLLNQILKSVVSVPSNIAEGAGRDSDNEFLYFLSVASGSASELETQLIISNNLNYFKSEEVQTIMDKLEVIQKKL